jgi:outer membrane protein OmpA-like peptidoglycan-associated protein
MSASSILALQRSAGNEAVGRALAGHAPAGVFRRGLLDALDLRHDESRLDAHEELEDFRAKPLAPLLNHKPSSGLGQFDVVADMRAGTMTVTLKVAYNFVDGDATKVPKGFRPEEFKWQPAEQAAWKARYQKDVGDLWSAKFQIKSTEQFWEAMVVNTTVSVVEDAAAPHFTLSVAKYPDDAAMVQSSICPPGYHHDAASGNCAANAAGNGSGTADLDSNDMRPEQKLDWGNANSAIGFSEGGTALDATGTAALAPIITAVKGKPESHVELTGRASNTHKRGATADAGAIDNMDLARKRSAAVQAALLAGGLTGDQVLVRNEGENGAGAGKEWCRVDAQVGTKQTQDPALHETGHMLGNEDEYTSTGSAAGSAMPAKYDAMIKAQTGDVVTHADDESAMSMGSTVRKWNYAAFLEGLKEITKKSEWTL